MLRVLGRLASSPSAGGRGHLGRFVAAILLLLLSTRLAIAGGDSYEPNDTLNDISGNANNQILSGTQIESWISSDDDIDLFWFEVSQAGDVQIALTSLPTDYDLCLYDIEDLTTPRACSENKGASDEFLGGTLEAGVYILSIFAYNGSDPSDSYLLRADYPGGQKENTPPSASLTRPAGGETWQVGSVEQIRYSAADSETPDTQLVITLEYSTNDGSTWNSIFTNQPNSSGGVYSWTVPNTPTSSARIRVTASDGALNNSAQSAPFSITGIQGSNVLSLNSGSGESGTEVRLELSLANENPFAALQTDVVFDATVVEFLGVTARRRDPGDPGPVFSDSSNVVAPGRARIVLWSPDGSDLPAGSGVIADLKFRLLGAGGRSTTVSLDGSVLSHSTGGGLPVTASGGSIDVLGTGDNTVALGSSSGAAGQSLALPLSLGNQIEMKALQLDFQFDATVVAFLGGTVASRGPGLIAEFNEVGPGTVRGVFYFQDARTLPPGDGVIGNLTFSLRGAAGSRTDIAMANVILSNDEASQADVTVTSGEIIVTEGAGQTPVLDLSALKNPGRPGAYQIFVTVVNGSGTAPVVQIGGASATLNRLANGTYMLTHFLSRGSGSVTVRVSDTNGKGTGTAEISISG